MERSKLSNKKIVALAVLSILLLSLLAINITFAYFTSSASSTNDQTITFDTLTLAVNDSTDWTMSQSDNEQLTNLVPGCTVNMAGIVNLTGANAYLKVTFTLTPTSGVVDTTATNAIATGLGAALRAQDVTNWVFVDGAWYCVAENTGSTSGNTVIDFSRGSFTIPLEATGNDWQGKSITVSYTVEAIQSAHVTLAGSTDNEKATSLKNLFDSVDISTGRLNG